MKSKYYLVLGNVVLTAITSLIIGINYHFHGTIDVFSFAIFIITMIIPSIYILLAYRKKNDSSLNEVLIPSVIWTGMFFLANIIASIIFLATHPENWNVLFYTELIIVGLYFVGLFIIFAATSHIRKVYK